MVVISAVVQCHIQIQGGSEKRGGRLPIKA